MFHLKIPVIHVKPLLLWAAFWGRGGRLGGGKGVRGGGGEGGGADLLAMLTQVNKTMKDNRGQGNIVTLSPGIYYNSYNVYCTYFIQLHVLYSTYKYRSTEFLFL